ncbi:MAG TPA: GAF domain-containing sensor histidine kinase [Anaerolineales bacterium]|nr:GAF domain-containing sensor histidine kinase [Anaerolineales bacterium]
MLLTREQLQERLIALHQASLELVKDVSLETLLERIATVACEQADARYAALGVLDHHGKLEKFISVGMTGKEIKRIPHPPQGQGLIGALMNSKEPLRVPVIKEHPQSVGFPVHHPPMRSFLGVPIRTGDRQLGQIYLTEKRDAPEFTADDEKIIQMLAAYAATAISNARLYEQMRERDIALTRRNVDMALLNGIASTLTSSLELDEILNKTLGLVMNYMRVEAGEIFLLEEDRKSLRMVLHRGQAAEAFWTRNVFKVGDGYIGVVAETRKPVVSTDLANDVRFLREAVVKAGFHQIACIPLLSGDNLMGVMSVATLGVEPIDDRNVEMMAAVGNWAGLAIENARLHSNARRLAVLEERERIGMDLHDGIIQSIYGVGLSLENAFHSVDEDPDDAKKLVQHAINGLNQAIRDLRSYILDLRPRQLGNDGLMSGIKRLISEYRANTFSDVHVTEPESDLKDLPQGHILTLFHICQEALANSAKHAKAKRVQIAVWATDERVLMEIADDGKGFDMVAMNANIGHGLANMRTRARSMGGDVDISSAPDEGTTILAWVPRDARQ